MQYRFERLDTAGADVDKLEDALRQSMVEAQNRVMQDFARFNAEQQQQQADFELAIRKNSDDIANQLTALENELNELKSTAYNNVSSKLQDFEKEFIADLTRRGDNITVDLEQWKEEFDTKLKILQSDYESSRHGLEVSYTDTLKERVSVLQDKTKEYLVRFETAVKQSETAVQGRISSLEQELRTFIEQYRSKLEETKSSMDGQLSSNIEQHAALVEEQLARIEKELDSRIAEMNAQTADSLEKNRVVIDGLLTDLNAWQTRMDAQFDESRSVFNNKLSHFEQNSSDLISQVQNSFKTDLNGYNDRVQEIYAELDNKLAQVKAVSEQTISGCESRAAQVLDEFQQSYDAMLEENQRRIRDQNIEADQKLRALKSMVLEIRDKNEALQADMVMKLQAKTTEINLQLDDIDKRIKHCVSQVPSMEKTNEMRSKMESELDALQAEMGRLNVFKSETTALENELQKIRQMDDDINQRLQAFTAGKKHIDMLESDFARLMGLSETMDAKISELQTINDDLQNMQVEIRRFQDSLTNISTRYDRLEKKNSVLDRTIIDVDNAFKNLEQIEKRLAQCGLQVDQMPEKIENVRRDVDRLVDNSGRISEAMEKLDSLDSIITETSNRIDEVMNARDGIARSETRLRDIAKQADEQVKLLGALIKQDMAKNAPSAGAPPVSVRERVIQLAHQNWKPAEIARGLNLTEGEVELILEMPQL